MLERAELRGLTAELVELFNDMTTTSQVTAWD